jgi:hypothetical protein
MNLTEFLKSEEKKGYSIDANIIELGDSIYEEEFDNLVVSSQKEFISFLLNKEDTLENTELSTILTILTLKGFNRNKLCVEMNYLNKNDDEKILKTYEMLNLLGCSIFVVPEENFNESDYLNLTIIMKEKLFSENNKIFIYPIINFIEYVQLKLMIENFVENKESENIKNLLNPLPNDEILNILLKYNSSDTINNFKSKYLDSISLEEKAIMIRDIQVTLSSIKNEIESNHDFYNIKIIKNY